jgi:hypothetical protein
MDVSSVYPGEMTDWFGEISAWTGGQGAEEVDLCEELEVGAFNCWTGLHEVLVVGVEACRLEDVKNCERVYGVKELGLNKGVYVYKPS